MLRTSAIIGSTENSDEGAVVPEFIAVLDNHVGTANEVHVIPSQELVDDGLAKAKADPSLVVFPVEGGITGVRPQKVVEEAVVRYVSRALYPLDVFQRVYGWRKTTVNTENFGGDDGCDREAVEHVDKCFPYLCITSSFALVVKSVY
jgi:hypothetical protein